jgi:hypothetical protein
MPKYEWYEGFEYQLMGMLMVGGLQYFIKGKCALYIKTDAQFMWCGR